MAGSTPRIAVLGGDGIGPDVAAAAERVLRSVRPDCTFTHHHFGGAGLRHHGNPDPEATREACDVSDAILFGAVGGPEFDWRPAEERPETALLALRKRHELFANLRPVRMIPGLEHVSTLRADVVCGVDVAIVRELTGGAYFGPKTSTTDGRERVATDTIVYRESEIERIASFAFELARTRRKHVMSVDKQNVLSTSRLWRDVVNAVASRYADVGLDHMLVDTAAMQLVRDPRRFDVLLTENMFGDILSDEAAMLTGSIGNLPSASVGTRSTAFGVFGLYEPIAGTAPDIAGLGVANPVGAILSAALLARHSLNDAAAAERIEAAVDRAIAGGARTRDIAGGGPSLSTDAFTEAVITTLERPVEQVS